MNPQSEKILSIIQTVEKQITRQLGFLPMLVADLGFWRRADCRRKRR